MFGDLQGHIFLRLIRRRTQVRGADHVFQGEKWAIGGGLDLKHIQGSTSQMAGLERFGQRHFITADPNGVLIDVVTPIPPSPEFAALYSEAALPG